MKNIDTYIFEGLIGSSTRDIKPVGEVLRDVFSKFNGPFAKEVAEELYGMMDTLPGTRKYIRGMMIQKDYVQKNDPIIISFEMRHRHITNNIYIGRPMENVCIYIDLYGKRVYRLNSFQSAAPFVYKYTIYKNSGMFRISDSFDSWIIDKDAPSRSIFEEAMENLSK